MNSQSKSVNREACAWIAKLHDAELSPQDRAALREWMQKSPRHRAELRRMARRWGELNVLTELAVPVETPGLRNIAHFSPLQGLGRKAAAGFITGAALLVAVLWQQLSLSDREVPSSSIYATAIGEQRLVTLPDSSTALLNTNSQLTADYTAGFRNVHLIRGEAYFDVTPNSNRPFRVFADNRVVRAVGTAFSVRIKDRIIDVTVTEGSVQINTVRVTVDSRSPTIDEAGTPAVVSAGQSAIFDEVLESIETIGHSEISRKLAWQEGLLRFSGEPLDEVVEEVSRYTPLSIVIVDSELRDLRIGGLFEVGETDRMFEALERSFGVHVEYIDKNLVHLSTVKSTTRDL